MILNVYLTQQTDISRILKPKFDETDDVDNVSPHSKYIDNITHSSENNPFEQM